MNYLSLLPDLSEHEEVTVAPHLCQHHSRHRRALMVPLCSDKESSISLWPALIAGKGHRAPKRVKVHWKT